MQQYAVSINGARPTVYYNPRLSVHPFDYATKKDATFQWNIAFQWDVRILSLNNGVLWKKMLNFKEVEEEF